MICEACGSSRWVVLGDLGALRWFRCRACGLEVPDVQVGGLESLEDLDGLPRWHVIRVEG